MYCRLNFLDGIILMLFWSVRVHASQNEHKPNIEENKITWKLKLTFNFWQWINIAIYTIVRLNGTNFEKQIRYAQ